MSTEKESTEKVTRVTVTLKKPLIQNREQKAPGDEIKVTPAQKKRLSESQHI